MWKLTPPSQQTIDWYLDKKLAGLKNRITSSDKLPDDVKAILVPNYHDSDTSDDSELRGLLIEWPQQSFARNQRLMAEICCLEPYHSNQEELEKLKKLLVDVFDYENQISGSKATSYYLTYMQGRFTCTYCNIHYIITAVSGMKHTKGNKLGKNDEERIARPQLDHWFDKGDHPLLSLNIFNLIPSCPTCNTTAKGRTHFSLDTHIHPYLYAEEDPRFKFQIEKSPNDALFPFQVVLDMRESTPQEKEMIKALSLREIYAYYGGLEAKDIYDLVTSFSPVYLQTLFRSLGDKFHLPMENLYKMIFGVEYQNNNNLDRPLSKLKRDILTQLGFLDVNGKFIL